MIGGASAEDCNKRIRAVQLPEKYAEDNAMLTPQQKEYVNHLYVPPYPYHIHIVN